MIASAISRYGLQEKTWTRKALHAVLHYFFPVGEQALQPLQRYFGDTFDLTIFFIKDNWLEWFWHTESMDRLREKFLLRVDKEPSFLSGWKKEWMRRLRKLDKITQEVQSKEFSYLSDRQLYALFLMWYRAYLDEYGLAIGIQDAFSMRAEAFLLPYFQKVLQAKGVTAPDEMTRELLQAVDESFLTQEYRDRLLLLQKQQKGRDISPDLKKHAKKYHWLKNNYAKDICLDAAYFLKELQEMNKLNPAEELKRLNVDLQQRKARKKVLIKELKLDKKAKNRIKITEVFAFMQDERKKYVLLATHQERKFLEEVSRRSRIPTEDLEWTVIYEIPALLNGTFDLSQIPERKKYCCVIWTLQGYELIAGKEAEKIFEVFQQAASAEEEIRGIVACPGKVSGRVRIIRKRHDLINLHQGEILVTSMTRPEMVVAMKKAAAIVTDEGGITSHAAVVSRELHVPCIIGTKIATKVFRDGDVVEVDAEKGIVRMKQWEK